LNKKLYWALIIVFSLVFVISAVYVIDYAIDSYRYKQQLGDLQITQPTRPPVTLLPPTTGTVTDPTYTEPTLPDWTNGPTWPTNPGGPTNGRPTDPTGPSGMLADLEALYKLNNDVVGYIYIPDTNVNNPVLQRPSMKDYYLYRDFYGNEDRHGSVYVREACDVFGPSDNVTIYGHNMADGSMFANIHKYKDKTFFDNHPLIYFDTLYERHTYQVVCLFRTSGSYGVGFPYHLYDNFKDEAEFKEFVNGVRGKKFANDPEYDLIFDSGISVKYGDKFICLSTCEEWPITNGRLVLVAVRIL
jgi:sortase B